MSLVRIADGHVGWRRDGDVAASVRIEREDGEFVLVALEADDDAAAGELVEAIAGAATGVPCIFGVVTDGVRVDRHVWNVLPSGLAVDLSRDQFRNGERFEAPEPLTETAVPGTEERYELLAARVREQLSRR